ncbi:MAG: MerR family DNA-binding transcriptional regulator [Gammaproteobacteria bacterium]|nr:MerR family DNA-binding transcriptional regulator [Gammaproteobacteria bacterium]
MDSAPAYPIRVVAELTGVTPSTLRAWERRYGQPAPSRTASGHRLYSQRDILAIREMHRRVASGESPAVAARQPAAAATGIEEAWTLHRRRLLQAIERFDPAELDRVYGELLALFRIDLVTDRLLRPTIETLGERWQESDTGIAEEHFFTAFLRNKLGARLHHVSPHAGGARLVTACLPGERHELGLLLFGLAANGLGYRPLHLGADLPVEQAARVVARTRADGLLLSGTTRDLDAPLLEALAALPGSLGVPVAIGGPLADRERVRLAGHGLVPIGGDQGTALDELLRAVPPRGRTP